VRRLSWVRFLHKIFLFLSVFCIVLLLSPVSLASVPTPNTMYVWGANYSDQLGDGSTGKSNLPIQISDLSDVVSIAAGETHVLALKSDGTVWAWGTNVVGELGNGTNTDSNIPVKVSGLTNVVAIAASGG
jgi:alpha-tubulin suppressor-like RCC1 family protein